MGLKVINRVYTNNAGVSGGFLLANNNDYNNVVYTIELSQNTVLEQL